MTYSDFRTTISVDELVNIFNADSTFEWCDGIECPVNGPGCDGHHCTDADIMCARGECNHIWEYAELHDYEVID